MHERRGKSRFCKTKSAIKDSSTIGGLTKKKEKKEARSDIGIPSQQEKGPPGQFQKVLFATHTEGASQL